MIQLTRKGNMPIDKSISIPQMKSLLRSLFLHPPKVGATGFCGGPGIAKTAIIRETAQELGIGLSVINAGLVGLGEISGVVFPQMDSRKSVLFPSELLDHERATFVDEFSNSDHSVFKAFSNLLVDGTIPGHPTPYPQARLFAYNPPTVSELAHNIPVIVRNRADIYEVHYTAADFLTHAMHNPAFHPVVVSFVLEFGDAILQVKDFKPPAFRTCGAPTPNVDDGFPSPRAYEVLSDRLFRIENEAEQVPVSVLANAILGQTGKGFSDYYKLREYLPSVSEILKGQSVPFPKESMQKDGKKPFATVVYMTCIYGLNAAETPEQYANFVKWIFHKVSEGILDNELLFTLIKLSALGPHKTRATSVLTEIGKAALGAEDFKKFIKLLMKNASEASSV